MKRGRNTDEIATVQHRCSIRDYEKPQPPLLQKTTSARFARKPSLYLTPLIGKTCPAFRKAGVHLFMSPCYLSRFCPAPFAER